MGARITLARGEPIDVEGSAYELVGQLQPGGGLVRLETTSGRRGIYINPAHVNAVVETESTWFRPELLQ